MSFGIFWVRALKLSSSKMVQKMHFWSVFDDSDHLFDTFARLCCILAIQKIIFSKWKNTINIPLDWWVGTRAPPFHKNLVYVMVGYRYICIEWILFWAYILWNTTIVLPSRPDMQRNASPVCYGNGKKMNSGNQENLTCILWNWLFFEGVILRYLKIF